MTNVLRLLSCLALLLTTGLMATAQTYLPWQPYRPDRPLHFASTSRVQNDSLFIRGGMPDTINYTTYRRVKYDSVLNNGTYFMARRHYGYISSCSPDSSQTVFPELFNPASEVMGGHTTLFGDQQELVGPHIWRIRMANRWDYYLDTDTNVAGLRYSYRLTNGTTVSVQSHDSLKNENYLGALQPIKTYYLVGQYRTYLKLSLDNGLVEIGNKTRNYTKVFSTTDESISPLTEGEYYNFQLGDTLQMVSATWGPGSDGIQIIQKTPLQITTNGNIRTITWQNSVYTRTYTCSTCPFAFSRQFTTNDSINIDKPMHNWPIDTSLDGSQYPTAWRGLSRYGMLNKIKGLVINSIPQYYNHLNPLHSPSCYYSVGLDMYLPDPSISIFDQPVRNISRGIGLHLSGTGYARINGQSFGTRYNLIAVGLDKLISKQGNLALLPNPASSSILLTELGAPLASTPFLIMDYTGKVVQQGTTSEAGSIDIHSLPKGLYQIISRQQTVRLAVQ